MSFDLEKIANYQIVFKMYLQFLRNLMHTPAANTGLCLFLSKINVQNRDNNIF